MLPVGDIILGAATRQVDVGDEPVDFSLGESTFLECLMRHPDQSTGGDARLAFTDDEPEVSQSTESGTSIATGADSTCKRSPAGSA